MLDRELPKIGEKFPKIIEGPFYIGIDTIGYHRISIMISFLSKQRDSQNMKRAVNRELWELFVKNGYQL